jgi:hypothetical protein
MLEVAVLVIIGKEVGIHDVIWMSLDSVQDALNRIDKYPKLSNCGDTYVF